MDEVADPLGNNLTLVDKCAKFALESDGKRNFGMQSGEQTKNPVFYDFYYGQAFIDSDVLALVYEITGLDNELLEWGVAPYNWMLT